MINKQKNWEIGSMCKVDVRMADGSSSNNKKEDQDSNNLVVSIRDFSFGVGGKIFPYSLYITPFFSGI